MTKSIQRWKQRGAASFDGDVDRGPALLHANNLETAPRWPRTNHQSANRAQWNRNLVKTPKHKKNFIC